MTTIRLRANPSQRANIETLLNYLRQRLAAKDKTYDHDSLATCTIGFAIRSRMFDCLNRYKVEDDSIRLQDGRHSCVSDATLSRLFGSDYVQYIVFPTRAHKNPCDPFRSSSTASLRYVIKWIEKFYDLGTPVAAEIIQHADSLRTTAEARVAVLEEVIAACVVLSKHNPHESIKSLQQASETELRILKNLLNK